MRGWFAGALELVGWGVEMDAEECLRALSLAARPVDTMWFEGWCTREEALAAPTAAHVEEFADVCGVGDPKLLAFVVRRHAERFGEWPRKGSAVAPSP